jgi:hypothetical protein
MESPELLFKSTRAVKINLLPIQFLILDVALVPRLLTHSIHSLTHPIHIYSYTDPSPFHSYLLVTYKHSMYIELLQSIESELESLVCRYLAVCSPSHIFNS